MLNKHKESDMFESVKLFLERSGCEEVYGEVGNFDVLGLNGPCNVIVEMKNQLSNKVIEQAIDALPYAEYVYIAVPKRKTSIPNFLMKVFKEYKIGVLYVDIESEKVSVIIPARFNRKSRKNRFDGTKRFNIRSQIKPFQKEIIGGVKSGEKKTEYSVMIDEIKSLLRRKKDWVTIDEILDTCEIYYARPKPSVISTLQAEWNKDWCETKVEGRIRYFRLKK